MGRAIAGSPGHIVLCGAGRAVRVLIDEVNGRRGIVVIEQDGASVAGTDLLTVVGDARRDEVLIEAASSGPPRSSRRSTPTPTAST